VGTLSAALRLALAIALAWLMPWRAALRMRDQKTTITFLVNAIVKLDKEQPRGRHLRLVK
jgi:hypothetical protein